MDTREAYVGIDVAFAKRKLLPVAVCIKTDVPLEILPLRANFDKPPAGRGNVRALEEQARRQFAEEVLVWLRKLEEDEHLNLKRIAIDAPSDYCRNRAGRRAAEASLDAEGISCFTTPSEDAFRLIIEKCRKFLADGGKPSRMRTQTSFGCWLASNCFAC